MVLKLIKTPEEYQAALVELDRLIALNPLPNSPEADTIELIAVLMQRYDDEHSSLKTVNVSPVDLIKFVMEQQGLTNRDLEPFIGSRSRVYEVLSGHRNLSKMMIAKLHEGLGIPIHYLFNTTPKRNTKTKRAVKRSRNQISGRSPTVSPH